MRRVCTLTFAVILVGAMTAGVCLASVPSTMSYQGKLTNSSAQPVADGAYSMTFAICDASVAGTSLWTETQPSVQVAGGLFTVQLGSVTPLPDSAFQGNSWLQTTVDGIVLTPRVQIVSAGYAIRARVAETVPNASLTSAGIASGQVVKSINTLKDAVTLAPGSNITITPSGNTLTLSTTAGSDRWSLTGNSGTAPGTNFLGTTDNKALELKVNGTRGLRLEPTAATPNVIGGYSGNQAFPGVIGAFIGGGGLPVVGTNRVTGDYGAISGGSGNSAGGSSQKYATVGGGQANRADGECSVVGGGEYNEAVNGSSTVGGGTNNSALGKYSTIAGGIGNTASNWDGVVGGGSNNTSSGYYSTVPGGIFNRAAGDYSFAAGQRAQANHRGSFVWSDSTTPYPDYFASTAADQFLIRASGGVGIGANDPQTPLDVNGVIRSRSGGYRFPDDTVQTTAAAAPADGSITTAKLADGAVTTAKVSDVAWSKLTGVPASLADGDNDTTYSNGAGLSLTGTAFSLDTTYTDGLYWKLGGNAGANPASNFIGTTDSQPLEIKVNDSRVLRLEHALDPSNYSAGTANIIGGSSANTVTAGVIGATIAGGGNTWVRNQITDNYGTVGGGKFNRAGDDMGATDDCAYAAVGGGQSNVASAIWSTVGGGFGNTAGGTCATVPGGFGNSASGAYSLAAGLAAKAAHNGAFVWADSAGNEYASTAADQFLIRASGGVGIGTNSPQQALSINAGMNVDQANTNNGTLNPGISFGTASGEGIASRRQAGANQWGLDFYTGFNNRMSITNGGNVGIGTTSPANALSVAGSSDVSGKLTVGAGAPQYTTRLDVAGGNNWDLGNTEGDVRVGNSSYRLKMGVALGGGGAGAASIRAVGGINMLVLGSGVNEVMFIRNGRTGIGTSDPQYVLHVNGSVAGVGAYNQLSDLRYKTNISTIGDALDKVAKLRGVTFDWKRAEHPELDFEDGRQIGLIAQEVEKICPEAVSKDEKGNYSVAYSSLVPVLIEAVKEQQKTIDEIKAELAALKAQLAKD